jgi:hypothetical protein
MLWLTMLKTAVGIAMLLEVLGNLAETLQHDGNDHFKVQRYIEKTLHSHTRTRTHTTARTELSHKS